MCNRDSRTSWQGNGHKVTPSARACSSPSCHCLFPLRNEHHADATHRPLAGPEGESVGRRYAGVLLRPVVPLQRLQ